MIRGAAINFYVNVFSALSLNERPGPDGRIAHALLQDRSSDVHGEGEWLTLPSRSPSAGDIRPSPERGGPRLCQTRALRVPVAWPQQEDRSNAAMTSWRSAWRSLRRAAGLPDVRFHDGRHTALTRLAEAGQPLWVIQAQIAHVSPR